MRNAYPPTLYRLPSPAIPANAGPQPGKRTALITLQEELQVLTGHGLVGARRMKIVRIDQTAALPNAMTLPRPPLQEPIAVSAQLVTASRGALPPPQPEPTELEGLLNGRRVHLRSVGEAMTDEAGNLYEMHGQHVRPLGELVSDERGRIFEVQPARQAQPIATEHPRASASEPEYVIPPFTPNNGHRAETTVQPTHTRVTQTEPIPAYRKIVADPGLYLKLPWARVKGELAPQLQHPEKLRDDDLLDCHAQIYEAQHTIPAAQLAALALGDAMFASQLQPLTHAKAQMLGAAELFKPTHEPFEMRGNSRQVYAGQRFYRLRPLFDPTSERIQNAGRPSVAAAKTAATTCSQIPQHYLNPLQFTYSREEALYDMNGVLGALPPQANALTRWLFIYPLRLLKVFRIVISSGRRLKKWRAMLQGKNPDEQLWAVTPPHGFSYHPTVRRWAEEMLTQAGYDPGRMLVEWEIFWRRKGWN
jgi:hypothetical protein